MENKKIKITFCGGAGTVTGANYLIEIDGKKILIDCGLFQGEEEVEELNWEPFAYDPKTIDYLIVTHAHIDHVGRIPKLINDGFGGKIYSTEPTKEIGEYMIEDTAGIMSHEKDPEIGKIYAEENVKKAMSLWEVFPYHQKVVVNEDFSFVFKNAGHVLGSAMVEFSCKGKKIVFTGDLGNSPSPILPDAEILTDANYLIMESVYGDRNHEHRDERTRRLAEVIQDNVKRRGVLVIPTFSLERSQELLFEINSLIEANRIPLVPIFFDSPLAIKLTKVFRSYKNYFNEKVQKITESGDDVFVFPGLRATMETAESKMIAKTPNPKVIIAGSGMSSGGRVLHHEKNYLPDPNNTLLLTGFQSPGTLGRYIENGAKTVRIMREEIEVKAVIEKISGYSGHKDSDNLLRFVENTAETLKKVFVVMGEPKSSLFLVQKIRDNLGIEVSAPIVGDSVEIEC